MYFLGCSLHSESAYTQLITLFTNPYIKFILWSFLAALTYHLFAGIRHLLMDMGLGEEVVSARRSAVIVIVLAIIAVIGIGVWIW